MFINEASKTPFRNNLIRLVLSAAVCNDAPVTFLIDGRGGSFTLLLNLQLIALYNAQHYYITALYPDFIQPKS